MRSPIRSASAVALTIALAILTWTAATAQVYARAKFDLPSQPLAESLKAVGVQAKINVLLRPALVDGRQAPALKAELTAQEALTRLLAGTDLEYKFVDDQTIVVKEKSPPSNEVHGAPLLPGVSENSSPGTGEEGARDSGKVDSGFWKRFQLAMAEKPSSGTREGQGNSSPSTGDEGTRGSVKDREEPVETILVTAQKRKERLQDVPISISVLSGADLDRSSFSSVSEALNTIPGVTTLASYLGGDTQVIVRGVPSSAHFSGASPIAYYLDSVPFGLIKSGLAPDASPYDLQQLEVLRGPQGTLYGASALNGVVRVLTHDADLNDLDFKARVSGSGTSGGGDNYRGDMAVNVPIVEGKLAARAVVGYEKDRGWIDAPNKSDVNDAKLGNYRLKVNAQPTENLSIGLSGWASRSTFGAPNASQPDQSITTPQDETLHNDWDAYGVKVGYRFPSLAITSSTSYLDYRNEGFLDVSQHFGAPSGSVAGLFTGTKANVFAEEVNLTSNLPGAWRWSAGGMYRRATEKLVQSIVDIFTIKFDNLSESYAGFGELTRLLLDGRLEVTAGLRYFHDEHSQENQSSESPLTWNVLQPIIPASSTASATTKRAVVSWRSSAQLLMYGSYSEGFRSGFPQSANTPSEFPPLDPDKLKNYEVGAKGSWLEGRVSFDTAIYYMDWLDVQQSVGVPFEGTFASAFVNGDSASGWGADLSLSARPIANLTIGASASWNDLALDSAVVTCSEAKGCYDLFAKGDRLVGSPQTTAGAWMNYAMPFGNGYKARLAVSGNYMSETQTSFDLAEVVVSTSDTIFTARTAFSIESPNRWIVTLYGDNVTNERGTPSRTPWPDFDARVRPRTVGLQFEYRYQ